MRAVPNFLATSATPATWELSLATKKNTTEQLMRPTAIPDPLVKIKPTKNQVADCIEEIKKRVKKRQRTLVTTLTKKTAEDLSQYLKDQGIKAHYLHSDVKTLDRSDTLDDLRRGKYDAIIGINLLREGLDLPEVSLVAILDADKEGFLRSEVTLIQTMGRAARHPKGEVILYADKKTGSIKRALREVERRRKYQLQKNRQLALSPKKIKKPIREKLIEREAKESIRDQKGAKRRFLLPQIDPSSLTPLDKRKLTQKLTKEMHLAAADLNFELAIEIRDKIKSLK
jgi:excinuclease ABC subunit B